MTVNREDYLKAIYELGGEKNKIGTKSIATALKVSAPSVSEMIKKLVIEGYVDYELYKGVMLTPNGLTRAKEIKKRHLLWEVFLVEKLGYNWEDVHVEAEILEHVTSPKLQELLEKYLGYPEACPHGSPIINKDAVYKYISLEKTAPGAKLRIKRFQDDKDILRYAKQEDLKIGDTIMVLEKNKYGNTNIQINGKSIEIEKELAKKIYVKGDV